MRDPGSARIKKQLPHLVFRYLKFLVLVCLAAVSTLIAYWANNLGQIRPIVVVRPLLVILLFVWVLFSLLLLILRSYHKSTLIMLLIITLFFSYGHIVNLTSQINLSGFAFNSFHLLILYVAIFLIGTVLVFRTKHLPEIVFSYFRIVAGLIVIYNLLHVLFFYPRLASSVKNSSAGVINAIQAENQPDIYYIVLDAYARDDILQEIYGFDNSTFLQDLRSRGFYIPECAYSNYDFTLNNVTSVLNMDYLNTLDVPNIALRQVSAQQVNLVLNNRVRKTFAKLGYQFVATRGYASFNDILNADIYLNYYASQGQRDELGELFFVKLFFDTTLVRARTEIALVNPVSAATENTASNSNTIDKNSLAYEESIFWYHQTNYVFDSIADLPEKPGNYLVYAHINSPHGPYVFNQDGSFRYPPGTTNENILYTDTLVYLNQRVLALIDTLIQKSAIPPIIIVQADHGTHYYRYGINKHKILSAYYLPGEVALQPYTTLTPVNDFRLILKNYFDHTIELLPDMLYIKSLNDYESVPASCDLQP